MYAMNAEYRAHDYLLEKSYYRFSDVGFALCLAHSETELLVLDKTFELLLDIAFGRWCGNKNSADISKYTIYYFSCIHKKMRCSCIMYVDLRLSIIQKFSFYKIHERNS